MPGSVVAAHVLRSCGSGAELLHSMWNPSGPATEPMSPALAGRFLSTVPPRKSDKDISRVYQGTL